MRVGLLSVQGVSFSVLYYFSKFVYDIDIYGFLRTYLKIYTSPCDVIRDHSSIILTDLLSEKYVSREQYMQSKSVPQSVAESARALPFGQWLSLRDSCLISGLVRSGFIRFSNPSISMSISINHCIGS